jgi:hypothetical protein
MWMVDVELSGGFRYLLVVGDGVLRSVSGLWEETLENGSSVARVARKYGINANQVFHWWR